MGGFILTDLPLPASSSLIFAQHGMIAARIFLRADLLMTSDPCDVREGDARASLLPDYLAPALPGTAKIGL
jgi:hypothetical protein